MSLISSMLPAESTHTSYSWMLRKAGRPAALANELKIFPIVRKSKHDVRVLRSNSCKHMINHESRTKHTTFFNASSGTFRAM